MNNKAATILTTAEMTERNEKWVSLLSLVVNYPCAGVIAVSFALGTICRNAWLILPGIVMIAYGVLYFNFIRSHTSLAWKNWVSRNRDSNNLPKGLWRTHSKIHAAFIKRQKAFLWGTFVLSIISYIGAFIFCECTYPGVTNLSEVSPAAAMFRMVLWSVIAATLSLWTSYVITHQKWVRDDAWNKMEQEMRDETRINLS